MKMGRACQCTPPPSPCWPSMIPRYREHFMRILNVFFFFDVRHIKLMNHKMLVGVEQNLIFSNIRYEHILVL
jgi:hypothetical protein